MKKANPILDKSKAFAIRIVNLYNYLKINKSEYVMSKQLLRSGTSIGANVRESVYAQSRADFLSKMYIALKEAGESAYWIEILEDTKYLTPSQAKSIYDDCDELIKILSSITNTTKNSKFLIPHS
ncbi:MAG: four helix bundle protein [Selenomonadaceae bacterium]|nr:four helix bundle protein [Selenomonadaceae bacterium]MBR6888379.1 four helix bundle protein [Selenomonadaceae bacterium]